MANGELAISYADVPDADGAGRVVASVGPVSWALELSTQSLRVGNLIYVVTTQEPVMRAPRADVAQSRAVTRAMLCGRCMPKLHLTARASSTRSFWRPKMAQARLWVSGRGRALASCSAQGA